MTPPKHPSEMSPRETRALAILQNDAHPITKTARNQWTVPSQTMPRLSYLVTRHALRGVEPRWTCTCPDHETRGTTCKHQYAVQFLLSVHAAPTTTTVAGERTEPPQSASAGVPAFPAAAAPACKWCRRPNVVKQGIKNGHQRYRCNDCRRNFIPAHGFERIAADPQCVCLALDLAFKGLSLRKITDTLNQFYALKVGKSTVHRWLDRYVTILNEYADTLTPQVGDKWHADEVFTKFSGKLQYVWHLMDAKTRYLLVSRVTEQRNGADARAVFDQARDLAGKVPAEVVTDGLPAYADAFNGAFNAARTHPRATHTREIHISKPQKFPHNNKVERLNGTLRERQKVARGLKSPTGPLTRGHAAYYNLLRPHQALDGQTPAEAAGIGLKNTEGQPRWAGAIRKAAQKQAA